MFSYTGAPGTINPATGKMTPLSPQPGNQGPQTGGPLTLDPNAVQQLGGNPAGGGPGGGAPPGPNNAYLGVGPAAPFLKDLYNSRPQFIQQQGQLLQSLGPQLRSSIFATSPELQQASDYLTKTFADPFAGQQSTFQDAIRTAEAARGFGGGGSGLAGEEARYLNNYAAQQRQQLLPQLQGLGNNLLGVSGLQAPPDMTLAAIGGLGFQNLGLQAQIQAGQQQAAISQELLKAYTANNPIGGANPFAAVGQQQNPFATGGFTFSSNTGGGGDRLAGTDAFGGMLTQDPRNNPFGTTAPGPRGSAPFDNSFTYTGSAYNPNTLAPMAGGGIMGNTGPQDAYSLAFAKYGDHDLAIQALAQGLA